MTPRPKRRTLAERDAQAIQTPPRKKEPHPRGNQRGVHVAEQTTATTTTRTTKATKRKSATQRLGAPATGRVIVNIWIDRTLWAQAKTLYLRAHPGHEVALVEWVDDIVNAYLDNRRASISAPMGDEGQIVKITLTPATKQRVIDTVEDHSLHGRAISRSAVISAAPSSRAACHAAGAHNHERGLRDMLLTTVVRSWVALFFALLIPLSSSPTIVSRVGDQEGATLGRAVFYVAVGVALVWATQPWRQAGRRRPWCFVVAFVLALVAGGRFIASSPEPGVALFLASSWVGLSYVVLAIETALTRPRQRR